MSESHADRFLARHQSGELLSELAQQAFEKRSLEFVLRTFGFKMPATAKILSRSFEERTGRYALRYSEFCRTYPDFPLLLGAQPIRGLSADPRCLLPALFKEFDRTPFVAEYAAFYERVHSVAGDRAVGLIFPRRGIVRGLVIHNGDRLDHRTRDGLCMIYQRGERRLYVQPFQSLIRALYNSGHGWRP